MGHRAAEDPALPPLQDPGNWLDLDAVPKAWSLGAQGHVKRISRELGNRKKWDERHMQHLPVKTQCFLQFGISCELGNRRHLLVKSQCFAQFGRRSAACTLMFPQQSLETKRCENIRERDGTNWPSWYRRWTQYSNPFYPVQPPRPQSSMLL